MLYIENNTEPTGMLCVLCSFRPTLYTLKMVFGSLISFCWWRIASLSRVADQKARSSSRLSRSGSSDHCASPRHAAFRSTLAAFTRG